MDEIASSESTSWQLPQKDLPTTATFIFQPPSFPQSFNKFSKILCFIEVFLCLNISNSKYLSKLYSHFPLASNKLCYPPDQICGLYNQRW